MDELDVKPALDARDGPRYYSFRDPVLKLELVAVGEQRRRTAGVDEHDVVRRLPSAKPDQRDQSREALARVNRIKR